MARPGGGAGAGGRNRPRDAGGKLIRSLVAQARMRTPPVIFLTIEPANGLRLRYYYNAISDSNRRLSCPSISAPASAIAEWSACGGCVRQRHCGVASEPASGRSSGPGLVCIGRRVSKLPPGWPSRSVPGKPSVLDFFLSDVPAKFAALHYDNAQ